MTLQLSDPSLLRHQSYINGQWVDADNGDTVAVTNPANGELIVDIAKVGADETRRAIEAAELADDLSIQKRAGGLDAGQGRPCLHHTQKGQAPRRVHAGGLDRLVRRACEGRGGDQQRQHQSRT